MLEKRLTILRKSDICVDLNNSRAVKQTNTNYRSLRKSLLSKLGSKATHYSADVDFLLEHYSGKSRAWLRAHDDNPVDEALVLITAKAVSELCAGKPLGYILGQAVFRDLSLRVNQDTLIPRSDTETLVDYALSLALPEDALIADLGTGSGAIALSLALEMPAARILATDISMITLQTARLNAELNQVHNVLFVQANWLVGLQGSFHLIISNPPYIDEQDPDLAEEVREYEPARALFSVQNGLADIRQLICQATVHLEKGGQLLLEHGHTQGEEVRELLSRAGFTETETGQDLAGRDRYTHGTWKG